MTKRSPTSARSQTASRSQKPASSRAVTPPKGHATRSRHDVEHQGRALGANAQWLIVTLLGIAALIIFLSTFR